MTQTVVAPVVHPHADAISYPEREQMITEILGLEDHGHLTLLILRPYSLRGLKLIYRGRVLGVRVGMAD